MNFLFLANCRVASLLWNHSMSDGIERSTKGKVGCFCRRRTVAEDELKVNVWKDLFVHSTKLLGVIFDRKMI